MAGYKINLPFKTEISDEGLTKPACTCYHKKNRYKEKTDTMFKKFFPDEYLESTYKIDFEEQYRKGYRGIIFDIDNTLVPHGAPSDKRAEKLFEGLKKMGFQCCLLSNNQYQRVSSFNEKIQVHFIENAHKPSRKNYLKAMELMGTKIENTLFVGDQLFTDVYGAKRVGIHNILVKPIHPKEEIQIVLKRKLEKIVLFFYAKEQRKRKKS